MKVAFFIPNLGAGGAQRSMLTVALSLKEKYNYDVYVVSWEDSNAKYTVPLSLNYYNLGRYEYCKISKFNYFYSIYKLRQAIKNINPDYIISVSTVVYLRVFLASLFIGVKHYVWEHTSMSRYVGYESEIARNYFYKYCNRVIVLTNKDLNYVKDKYNKISVIPNPLPFANLNEVNSKENTVVAIGRLDVWEIKGFDILIRIWAQVSKSNPNWKLKIIGEGRPSDEAYLQSLIDDSCLGDRIELCGYRTDVDEILRNSKVFVLTSRIEGFPMCLIEAMSQGCACVSFSIDHAIEDIITDQIDGFIINDGAENDFVEKLSLLLNDENTIRRLSLNAVSNIQRFSSDSVAKMWCSILN